MLPKKLLLILLGLILATWFLMGEKKSVAEKFGILIFLIVVYVAFRLFTGATVDDILAPLLDTSGFVGPTEM